LAHAPIGPSLAGELKLFWDGRAKSSTCAPIRTGLRPDPEAPRVLAAALAAQADLIASGDKRDLLPLGSYQGIPIVSARQAVELLAARQVKEQ
jgi:predicted nucleic acid-binding protein